MIKHNMKRTAFLVLLVVGFLPGCKKADTAVDSTPPADATATNGQAAPSQLPPQSPPPVSVSPGDDAPKIKAGDLTQLTFELRKFVVQHQHKPRDFQEFANTSGIQIPPPPAGKKYAINFKLMSVILEDQ
jgi:hypothetical protein